MKREVTVKEITHRENDGKLLLEENGGQFVYVACALPLAELPFYRVGQRLILTIEREAPNAE